MNKNNIDDFVFNVIKAKYERINEMNKIIEGDKKNLNSKKIPKPITMKKGLFVFFLIMFSGLYASPGELFVYDHAKVTKKFLDVNRIDKIVSESNVGLETLQPLLSHLPEFSLLQMYDDDRALGIPGWVYGAGCAIGGGCVLGIIGAVGAGLTGVLLVYLLSNQDKGETLSAFYGCLGGSLIALVFNLILYTSY